MSINDNNRDGSVGLNTPVTELSEQASSQGPIRAHEPIDGSEKTEPVIRFATRTAAKGAEGISKGKLILLGGGLAVAVLFFVFTAIVGKSPKKLVAAKPPSQQAKQEQQQPSRGSVTPLMDTVRTPAPDNSSGQLGPGDIRRTRTLDNSSGTKPFAGKPAVASSLGNVPSFADTQQKWEDPAPYGGTPATVTPQTQQNSLKESSLVFVRSVAQSPVLTAQKINTDENGTPRLELTPGTRIQAKLETQISSAVQAPVVAVVEYTYAIGDRIIVPAGARVYGQLQQADRSRTGEREVRRDRTSRRSAGEDRRCRYWAGPRTHQRKRVREEHGQELSCARSVGTRFGSRGSGRKQYQWGVLRG